MIPSVSSLSLYFSLSSQQPFLLVLSVPPLWSLQILQFLHLLIHHFILEQLIEPSHVITVFMSSFSYFIILNVNAQLSNFGSASLTAYNFTLRIAKALVRRFRSSDSHEPLSFPIS